MIPSFSRSATQVFLEIYADTSKYDPKKLTDLAKNLETADVSGKKVVGTVKNLLDKSILLSRTPFLDIKSLNAGARIIQSLRKNVVDLGRDYADAIAKQKAAQVNLTQVGLTGIGDRDNTFAVKQAKRELQEAKTTTLGVKRELAERARALKNYVTAYDASNKRLNQIDAKRHQMAKSIYSFVDNRRFMTEAQRSQAFAIANVFESSNPKTKTGQKDLATAAKDWDRLTASMVRQKAEMSGVHRAWEKFRVVFSRVLDALGSFVIINTAQRLIVGFMTSIVNSNQLLERLNARLSLLTRNNAELVGIQKELIRLTVKTPFDIQQLVEGAGLLRAYSKDIVGSMKFVADWASSVGRDVEDTAVAFGKIVAHSPRTNLLLSTRGFDPALYESYVRKFQDREIALQQMIADNFGGMAERLSRTMEGIQANIGDMWVQLSAKLGAPLFETLKSDLFYIYKQSEDIVENGESVVSIIAELINYSVKFAAIGAVAGGVALSFKHIVSWVTLLIPALRAAEVIMLRWSKTGVFAVLSAILVGIGEIYSSKKLATIKKDYDDLLNQRVGAKSMQERMIVEEQILENLKMQNAEASWYLKTNSPRVSAELNAIGRLEIRIQKQKDLLEITKQQLEISKLADAAEVARGNEFEKYQAMKQLSDKGVLKETIQPLVNAGSIQEKYLLGKLREAQQFGTAIVNGKPMTEHELTIAYSIAENRLKMLSGIMTGTLSKAIQSMNQNMVAFLSKTMSGDALKQATEDWRTFMEFIEQTVSIIDKPAKGGSIFDDAKWAELTGRIEAYDTSLNKVYSDLTGHLKRYQELSGKTDEQMKSLTIQSLIEEQSTLKKTEGNLKLKGAMADLIDVYVKYIDAVKKNKIDTKDIDAYNSKILVLRRTMMNFRKELTKEKMSRYGVNEYGQLFEFAKGKTKKAEEMFYKSTPGSKEHLKYAEDYLKTLQKEYEMYQLLHKSSTNFGEAYLGILGDVRAKNQQIFDDLAKISYEFFTDTGKGILNELLFGDTTEKLTQEIDDLRFKLIEIQAEKAGHQLIEDTEVSTLARINELEAERANVILPILEKSLQSVTDKMSDIVFSQLAEEALSGILGDVEAKKLSEIQSYQDKIAELESRLQTIATVQLVALNGMLDVTLSKYDLILMKIQQINSALITKQFLDVGLGQNFSPIPKGGSSSGDGTPTEQMGSKVVRPIYRSGQSVNNNYSFVIPGNIYGYDDFKNKVDGAIRDLKRRSV